MTDKPKRTKPLPIEIRVMTAAFAEELAALQVIIFPMLNDDELFSADNYRHHVEVFPDGQYVAVLRHPDGDRIVGASSAIRYNIDFDHYQHKFSELTDNGWLTTSHNPDGEWLYGIDMSVHPDFRRRRIASRLYRVRANIARRLNLRGEVIAGLMPGYDKHRKTHTIEQYVEAVAANELTDPTLTAQIRQGFRVHGILYDHLTDPRSDNHALLMVRDNPDYVPTSLEDLP